MKHLNIALIRIMFYYICPRYWDFKSTSDGRTSGRIKDRVADPNVKNLELDGKHIFEFRKKQPTL